MRRTSVITIDAYIKTFPKNVQVLLQQLRDTIRKAAPQAEEVINYQMPTFKLEGNLVHFAAYKKHIGFYPAPSGLKKFQKEITKYKHSKGAVQFPLDKPLPLGLITKIVNYRVKENLEKARRKMKLKKNDNSKSSSTDKTTPGKHQVDQYIEMLSHPLIAIVKSLRKIILSADPEIGEQIKWNSPAFYFTGTMKSYDPKEYKRDIVVMNLHKKDFIMLVFPTGAIIPDTSGLLEGNLKDGRKTAIFRTEKEVIQKKKILQKIIKQWLALVDR